MKRVIAAILLLIVMVSLCACEQKEPKGVQEEEIRAICDLATLDCYYNNVVKLKKEANNIFQKDRIMWIEYESKVTIGIDMSDVVIRINGDTVSIKLPETKVLSTNFTLKEGSFIASEDGWLFKNKITPEEEQKAIKEGQDQLKETVLKDKARLIQANERAKELIGNYITNLEKSTGKDYTIEWN